MSLCIASAGTVLALAWSSFTLTWTHSVERIAWTERWEVSATGLRPIEAIVLGTGAGMEIPDGAEFIDGAWRYRPNLPEQKELLLAASGKTPSAWKLCNGRKCMTLGATESAPLRLWSSRLCRITSGG